MTEILVTQEGLEKLIAEHAQMQAERENAAERMRRALEFGGAFPENGEYLDARHELELVDCRAAMLERRLVGAEIVTPQQDGAVDIGEVVTVFDLESGKTNDYRLVGSGESNPSAWEVSHRSPIGAALLGRRVGDVVEFGVPSGRRRLEVVALEG